MDVIGRRLATEDGMLCGAQMDEAAIQVPDDMPMYDVRTDIPWHFEPRMPYADMLERIREADPELLEVLDEEEHPPPYPGAKSILHWTTNMVRTHIRGWPVASILQNMVKVAHQHVV